MVKERLWSEGGLILHPACTFPTSVAPVWQMGLVPLFVDVEPQTYQISPYAVEKAVHLHGARVVGAIIPFLLGNVPNFDFLFAVLTGEHNIPVIFDSCDVIGSWYDDVPAEAYGMAAAYSFYASHHVTTAGAGGAALTSDPAIHDRVRSAIYWGRKFVRTDDPYHDFCQRYTYREVGYDFQMTEIQAAFGLAQLDRLPEQNRRREQVFQNLWIHLAKCQKGEWIELPAEYSNASPSWFGFPVLIREEAPFNREKIVRYLLEHKVEIRPLFAGNILKQRAYRSLPRVECGPFTQADRCAERAFFLPAWAMSEEAEGYMHQVLADFLGGF
jgi:CDP-6-deoxy-D-xylo-4-hexulose-3-dehydrase